MTHWAKGSRVFSASVAALVFATSLSPVVNAPLEALPRRLGDGDSTGGDASYANQVVITVFGETGTATQQEGGAISCSLLECPRDVRAVGQWMLSIILRSMTSTQTGDDDLLSSEPPVVAVSVVPPFGYDPHAPQGREGDQRSAFRRTFFRFRFGHLTEAVGREVAGNLCRDYKREEEELLKAVQIALSKEGLRPWQAIDIASRLGLSLKSIIHLSSAVDSPAGASLIGAGCNWDVQAQFGSAQGAFFLPPCPENSHRADDPDEPWRCECDLGCQGTLQYTRLESGLYDYRGQCTLAIGFCRSAYTMRREDGELALGVLHEEAYAECPAGFESTGLAACLARGGQGAWSPSRLCRFVPPEAPVAPLCPEPERPDLVLQDCGGCQAELPRAGGAPPCPCRARCGEGYKQWDADAGHYRLVDGFGGPVACLNVPFRCPPEEALAWAPDAGEGSRCAMRETGEVLHGMDLCCPEAWGSSKPSDLSPADCRGVRDEEECYGSMQAGGEHGGSPCCWHQAAPGAPEESQVVCAPRDDPAVGAHIGEYGCAVPRHVPQAQWEDKFPTCERVCGNSFRAFEPNVVSKGCDACVPGHDPDCHCTVECRPGTVFFGGGPLGERACDASTRDFGPAPLCMEPPALPTRCLAPDAAGLSLVGSCGHCEVGRPCDCTMQCKPTHKHLQGQGEEGAMQCVLADAPLDRADCLQVTDRWACVHSKHDKPDGAGAEVPCCWRDDAFADGAARCAPRGSALLGTAHPPSVCADMKAASWQPEPPTCAPVCANPFRGLPDVETNGKCDRCLPGEACGCRAYCAAGAEHYGGGPTEPRTCGSATLDFGPPPVCGEPDLPHACARAELEGAGLQVTGCEGCRAGEACQCSAACPRSFADVRHGPQGGPQCEEEGALASAECGDLREAGACLGSAQKGSGSPCCWLGAGEAGAPSCLPKGSELLRSVPLHCAHPKARWANVPECKLKCKNSMRGALNIVFRPSVEACDSCVVGMPCECEVACAPGTLYYGGGPLHQRRCTESAPDLGEAPLCSSPRETLQPCVPPDEGLFAAEGDCAGCQPGEACGCRVRCRAGYRAPAGAEGARVCAKAEADLAPASCAAVEDQGACLQSREAPGGGPSAGKPCCYHPSEAAGEQVCAPMHSGLIDRPVHACAQQFVSRWDPPLPDCQPLCADIFAGLPGIVATGCGECVVGDESCKCDVRCAPGTEWYGGPQPGPRRCPASGRFEPPPVCGPPEPAPECKRSDIAGPGLRIEDCEECTAADGHECSCGVWCADDFLDSGAGGPEGKKRCHRRLRDPGTAKCADVEDRPTCVKSLEGSKPCIWQRASSGDGRSGICVAKGSPQVASMPDAGSYARLMYAEWDPMPACLLRCTHDFNSPFSSNVEATGCDRCHVGQRQPTDGGESGADVCTCTVRCADGTERYGGGSEGPRACDAAQPHLEPPPLCLPPKPAWCRKPLDRRLRVQGCEDCEAGGTACGPCDVQCGEGYLQSGGPVGTEKACREVEAAEKLRPGVCSGLSDKATCLGGKEEVAPGRFEPCCYRALTFNPGEGGGKGVLCAAKASALVPWNLPPEDCAPLTEGVWEGLPVCDAKCPNPFQGLEEFEEEGCDGCSVAHGAQCPCTVRCREPAQAMVGVDSHGVAFPQEGLKQCLLRDGRAEFERPPVCRQPCRTPGSEGGTLDVSQCTPESRASYAECFPGDQDCRCVVSCAPGLRPVGGGTNGGHFHCNEAGLYTGLPICRPLCKKPDEQFGRLDTSACGACVAGAADCRCRLSCRGPRAGGGPEGDYACLFAPGDDETPARGIWAVADEAERARLGERGRQLPACLSPIFVTVVSATTKDGLPGVLIEILIGGRVITSQTTPANGQISLDMISDEEITVAASLKDHAMIRRQFQRSKFCLDPTVNCGLRLSMSQVLKFGGHLNPQGCYFMADIGKSEWEMRAVLEWGSDPQDLDIWARNLDCSLSTASRYGCAGPDKSRCERYRFTWPAYQQLEIQSCGIFKCLKRSDGTTVLQADNKPRLTKPMAAQFDKWVYWNARYASLMQKRLLRPQAGGATPLVNIRASSIRIVTLAGFSGKVERRFCGGGACAILNGDYVERQGAGLLVGARETYWKGNAYLLFYCRADATWRVSTSRAFHQIRAGACDAFARSLPKREILDPAMIKLPELWDLEAFQTREGAAVSRLHLADGSKDLPWTDDNFMFLNVDHTTGYGPETVTFHNVPPSTYQIAVNTFSRNDVNDNIKGGSPTVSIYVGGDGQAIFQCSIRPECNNASRIWNVANLQIFEGGEEVVDGQRTGKSRYYLRLRDAFETLEPLQEVDMPTGDPREQLVPESAKYNPPAKMAYFRISSAHEYNDQQLAYVCYGECKPAPGYEQCLERPPP